VEYTVNTGDLRPLLAYRRAGIHPGLDGIFIAGGLERFADHATNIAEDARYFVQAISVRHNGARDRLNSRNGCLKS
jgi:phosphate uptake regulator